MKDNASVLFASDIHGKIDGFRQFARLLKKKKYEFGVLGGDLLDEWLPDELVMQLTGCTSDDLLDEIGSEDEDEIALWHGSSAIELQDKAIRLKASRIQGILSQAHKPIYFVLGNHDRIEWPETSGMTDIHLKRIDLEDYNLVGYRWTDPERTPEELTEDLERLDSLIDEHTILVSHSPPAGKLDGLAEWGNGYGLEILNRLHTEPYLNLVGHVHSLTGQKDTVINGAWPDCRKVTEINIEARASVLIE